MFSELEEVLGKAEAVVICGEIEETAPRGAWDPLFRERLGGVSSSVRDLWRDVSMIFNAF